MIPITRPCVGAEEADAARDAVLSGWLTQGARVAEFERAVADACGARHAVAVSNCTVALHLCLLDLGVGPGDEVVCPSMSFIATANAIRHTGAEPVFADVCPDTYNLDPHAAEEAVTPRTKAILLVHQIGLPADLDAFKDLAKRRGVCLLEDAACALGSSYKGRPVGGHGEVACFSFHPRKVITTGEGGMITTDDGVRAARLRLLRQHGMSVPDSVRHAASRVIVEEYPSVGYNCRMTDVQAAIGIEQMKRLGWIVARRRELASRYTQALSEHPWLSPPRIPEWAGPNFQSYAVQMRESSPMGRNDLMQTLLDCGISTRRGIMLAHREPAYAGHGRVGRLSRSERASDRSLLLPLYPQMTDEEQAQVIEALFKAAGERAR